MKGVHHAAFQAGIAQDALGSGHADLKLASDNSLSQDRANLTPRAFQAKHPDRCAYTHIEIAALEE